MIGKWNKSVILTYISLAISIIGIALLFNGMSIKYPIICLIISGVCDMFDGTVARRCKRDEEEKEFGIQLDSLVDTICFIVLPIVILCFTNFSLYFIPIYVLYAVCGIARLAYFNIKAPSSKAVSYYEGLPVTYIALLFPVFYLLFYVLKQNAFIYLINTLTIILAILYVIRIKVPKPRLIASIVLSLVAVIVTIIYILIYGEKRVIDVKKVIYLLQGKISIFFKIITWSNCLWRNIFYCSS